ncbi:ABC transporter permease [Paenibacillus sp. NEAU-GSW1]|uniref:ABC transporter permease n=1 Tax=Paenibacillus sp. NEAU-GSW1 TaxID=2682486 RepID=UPI0012E27091|nr:hypothetical protein [Paenibacillus sp. NEAU-GSW1]MUT66984.1 hypothetical protein [Paenibacillus sp. NEAU-GSW1]
MAVFRSIYHIARADLLERIRQYSFLVMLGLTIIGAYFFVPPIDSEYVTLHLDGQYRGIYNTAWVSASVALSTVTFLPLLGFYLIKNSIQRDRQTGVGQIIASTTVKKLTYMLGKAISNFAVLTIIMACVMVITLIMQRVRGEVLTIEFWPFISPFLFVTLPVLSVVAALAVLFESRNALQGGLGNAIYFVLFLAYATTSSLLPSGVTLVTSDMLQELTALKPDFTGTYGMGFLTVEQPLQSFEWQGVDWTGELILRQLIPFPIALVVVIAAALMFRGFQQVSERKDKTRKSKEKQEDTAAALEQGARSTPRIRAAELSPVSERNTLLALVIAEARLMLKKASLGWYLIAAVLIILGVALPTPISLNYMIWPFIWLWPIVLWSGMGNREALYRTQFLIAASPRVVVRQLYAIWISGVSMSLAIASGMLIRLAAEGEFSYFTFGLAAVILIPSIALACGVLTNTNRTFEVLYMIIWYMGPFNQMPYLNFLGFQSEGSLQTALTSNAGAMSLIYLAISAALLLVAYLWRKQALRGE